MPGSMSALGGVCPMIWRGVSHKVVDRRAGQAGPRLKGWETEMNNIFWIIGVIVVVLVVLSFLGLR
jgi:hypothetical protein